MYAFIDESGHTGENFRDNTQPVFYYLTILSKYNIHVLAKEKITSLCKQMNIERIHASELGKNNEILARPILNILKPFSPWFIFAEVEKRFLALAKLFDTLFDAGENLGARSHVYNFRALRILLLYNFSKITDDNLSYDFYDNCLFAHSQSKANQKLIEICEELLRRLNGQLDKRTEELIGDTLRWAINNPNEITTFNATKEHRWRHLPHVVTFVPTLQIIAKKVKERKTKIKKIIHDEQYQMKKVLREAHEFSSNINFPDSLQFADNPTMFFKQLKESQFELSSSKTNAGLQLVDFILHNYKKKDYIIANQSENINSLLLLKYYLQRSDLYKFSYDQLKDECQSIIKKISTFDLTNEQMNRGKELIENIESNYQKNKEKKA